MGDANDDRRVAGYKEVLKVVRAMIYHPAVHCPHSWAADQMHLQILQQRIRNMINEKEAHDTER